MNAKRNVNEFRQRLLSVVVKWYRTVFFFLCVCAPASWSTGSLCAQRSDANIETKWLNSRPRDKEHYIIYMYVRIHAHRGIYICILYMRYKLRSFDRWRSHRRSPKRSLPVRDRPLHKSKIALLRTKRHTKLVVLWYTFQAASAVYARGRADALAVNTRSRAHLHTQFAFVLIKFSYAHTKVSRPSRW